MTPGARLQSAIELLDAMFAAPSRPADAVASDWLRARRFIGGGDRRAILNRVYGTMRRRAQLGWWLRRCHLPEPAAPEGAAEPPAGHRYGPRMLVLADAMLRDGWPLHAVEEAFDGGRHRPDRLSVDELRVARGLVGKSIDDPGQAPAVRLNLPAWIEPALRAAFGPDFESEVAALDEPAPVDLRANLLKGGREQALEALRAEGFRAEPGRLAPCALRLAGRVSVVAGEAFRSGLVEVQDEGSQIVSALVGAAPGMTIIDWCAGAGGKTLAMASTMANKGRIVACDVSAGRLDRSAARLKRAGAFNVERRALDPEGRRWLRRLAGRADRVLVDAPCTGTGTWRRNPDGRWTLEPRDLVELVPKQAEILDAAAPFVRAGGRLVYATCSLLPDENERQAEAFLARHPEFAACPLAAVWRETLGTEAPADAVSGPWLRLTPARHGVDGFFAAVFERRAETP